MAKPMNILIPRAVGLLGVAYPHHATVLTEGVTSPSFVSSLLAHDAAQPLHALFPFHGIMSAAAVGRGDSVWLITERLGATSDGFRRAQARMRLHVGDSLRFASGKKFQSCIHRVVPFNPTEHRYSIAYFLRAEDDAMFMDSEGQYAFIDPPVWRAMAPKSMILGGMNEDGADDPQPVSGFLPEVAKETMLEV
ncbi:hypothetical protein VTI74DRAFT_3392 [Chaetomium olivicolor]